MISLVVLFVVAQSNAYGPFPWLDLGVGARELAMGGAGTAVCRTAAACYWNPGALVNLHGGSIVAYVPPTGPLGRYNELGDFRGFFAWGMPLLRKAGVGVAVDRMRLGGIEVRTGESEEPLDTAGYSETAMWLCGAVEALPSLDIGIGMLVLSYGFGGLNEEYKERFGGAGAGIGATLGCLYDATKWLKFGASARVPFVDSSLVGSQARLSARAGASVEPATGLTFAVDAVRVQRDRVEHTVNLGVEYRLSLFPADAADGALPLSASVRAGVSDLIGVRNVPQPSGGVGLDFRTAGFSGGVDCALVSRGAFGTEVAIGLSLFY